MNIENLIKGKTITNVNKLVAGKKAKITQAYGNLSGHNLPEGEVVTIVKYNGSSQSPYFGSFTCNTSLGQRTVYGAEMSISLEMKKEDIEKEINILEETIKKNKEEIIILEDKLKFIEENKLEQFDENQFKAYHILGLLEKDNMTKIEKAKLISELVNK